MVVRSLVAFCGLDVLAGEKLTRQAAEKGERLLVRLKTIAARSPHVREVRGRGLFIGIEVRPGNAMDFCRRLLDLGMLANDSHSHTIHISPPLVISDSEMDFMVERIEKVLVG